MSFVGAINTDLRAILNEMVQDWRDIPAVYVGCSGNFTVERILNKAGVKEIHGNDVSLYSCYLGSCLIGKPMEIEVVEGEFAWIKPYMIPGAPTVAAILLLGEILKFTGRTEPYHLRMVNAYMKDFQNLHQKTVEKLEKALEGIRLTTYYPGDVMDHLINAPENCVFISFPPTYKGGYEKLYLKLDQVFTWDNPEYQVFDELQFELFTKFLMEKGNWVTLRDHQVPEMEPFLRSKVQTGARSKPVYIYTNMVNSRLIMPRMKVEQIKMERFGPDDVITSETNLTLCSFTEGQMNLLRSEYLNAKIVPGKAAFYLGIIADGKLIGAIGFSPNPYLYGTGYIMSDFPIRPTRYKRMSKLILHVALSKEVRAICEQKFMMATHHLLTTAFTEKAVSMKYRGLFEIANKKEGMINYRAPAGKWTLREGLEKWLQKHSEK